MQTAPSPSAGRIVILGGGYIGQSFSAAFLDAGMPVTLVDPDPRARDAAEGGIALQTAAIRQAGLFRGGAGRLSVSETAGDILADAALVLECGPEQLETKQRIFAGLLAGAGAATVLATASSAIPMSQIVPDEDAHARCLVAHPVNPPAVLRVVELVPAPGTSAGTVSRASEIFGDCGFDPVVLGREIEGFVLNRLQGAVLREAYRLVAEGVCDSAAVDKIMRLGLGPRWALSGPFETVDLNTAGGIAAHAARMGPAYARMGAERGETVDWSADLVDRVAQERAALLPAAERPARQAWRAGAVARLVALRDRLLSESSQGE